MNINKCSYSGPDSDGDISFELNASHQNDHDADVELIKSSFVLVSGNGSYAGGSFGDFSETYIESGESETFDLYPPYVAPSLFDPAEDGAKILIQVNFCSRTPKKIGVFPMPKKPGEIVSIDANNAITEGVQLMGGKIIVGEPDDDGECLVEIRLGINNTTEKYIERVDLKAKVLDEEDEAVLDFDNYEPILPSAIMSLSCSGYIKKGKLKKCAEVKLTLSVYESIAFSSTEVRPTKE